MQPKYTPAVKTLAEGIRKLTVGEMLALKEALRGDFDLPPNAGVREPRVPHTPSDSAATFEDTGGTPFDDAV